MFLSEQTNDSNTALCFSNTKTVGKRLATERSKQCSDNTSRDAAAELDSVHSQHSWITKLKCYFSASYLWNCVGNSNSMHLLFQWRNNSEVLPQAFLFGIFSTQLMDTAWPSHFCEYIHSFLLYLYKWPQRKYFDTVILFVSIKSQKICNVSIIELTQKMH